MGFYVNLEMPKDCPMCPFAHYDMFNIVTGCDITRGKRWAMKNDKDYAESSTRPDWCPLIEIHEPHGRLIDADALIAYCKDFAEMYKGSSLPTDKARRDELFSVIGEIINMPTIIPASEGET